VATTITGTDLTWDESNWDEATWASGLGERSEVVTGSPLGNGKAKALRFKPLVLGEDWRLHGVTMKWIPRRVRS
jgi:hypothetical protein